MASKDPMDSIFRNLMEQFGIKEECENIKKTCINQNCSTNNLTSGQILVIIALLGGVLEVESVLVDKDQEVQIILSGSLKRKTQLDKIMDQVGSQPFDKVMKNLLGRY